MNKNKFSLNTLLDILGPKKKNILFAATLFGFANSATAFNPQSFQFSHSFETAMVEDAGHSTYSFLDAENYPQFFGLSYNYVEKPLITIDSSRSQFLGSIVEDYHSFDLNYTRRIALKNKMSIDLQLRTSLNFLKFYNAEKRSLGDTSIGTKVKLMEEGNTAFALTPYVILPTGNTNRFTSDDGLGVGLLGSLEHHMQDLHLYSNFGFQHSSKAKFSNIDLSNRVIVAFAGGYDLTKQMTLNLEWKGQFGLAFDEDQNPVDLLLDLKYKAKKGLNFFAGAGIGGVDFGGDDNIDSSDYRFLIGMKWAPESNGKVITKTVYKTKILREKEREIIENKLLLLKGVKFKSGKAILTEKSVGVLGYVAETIREFQSGIREIVVEGHTDSVGDAAFNKSLSLQRAQTVVKFLNSKGVAKKILKPMGFGESKPKVKELTKKDQDINRRVDFRVFFKKQ